MLHDKSLSQRRKEGEEETGRGNREKEKGEEDKGGGKQGRREDEGRKGGIKSPAKAVTISSLSGLPDW